MQKLSDILGQHKDEIMGVKVLDPEEEVMGTAQGWIKFDSPKKAKEVFCCKCNGNKGYLVLPNRYWSCIKLNCFNMSDKKMTTIIPETPPTERNTYVQPLTDMKEFGVPSSLFDAQFSKCKQDKKTIDFLSDWAKYPNGFIVLSGNSGSGKTYLSCCCIDSYRRQLKDSAFFLNISDLYMHWRSLDRQENKDIILLKKLLKQEFLVLDDLGIRTPSEAFLEFLYLLINKRDNPLKGTLITTNMTSQQMIDKLGHAMTSRICSGKIFVIEGKDRRIHKQLDLLNEY